jgi:hypothetical protein
MANNINITASDRRNNTYSFTLPFIKYKAPEIKLIGVEGNYTLIDDTYVIFGKTTFKFKASSVVGLSSIRYRIDEQEEQVIYLDGEREYEFSITIE